ncbi:MAG: type IV secretion system protein VirD4 [bacterium]|nr:MAG: type IV secretion system protein VirD4 [bacterium]
MLNQINNQHNVMQFPKPILIVGNENQRGFLNKLRECQDSFVCVATKEQTLSNTIDDRKEKEFWFYDPTDRFASYVFNWIPLCEYDRQLSLILAKSILGHKVKLVDGEFSDEYFNQKVMFLAALFAHANTLNAATPATLCSFVAGFISQNKCEPEKLLAMLLHSKNEIAGQYAKTFMSSNEGFLIELILCSVEEGLGWLKDNVRYNFTSTSLEPPNFARLRQEDISTYLDLTKSIETTPLGSIFFNLALYQLKQARNGRSVYLFVDDLATIGQITDLTLNLQVIRAYGIGLVLAVGSLDKLEQVYGKNDAQVIASNIFRVETELVLA